jgi:dihydroxyacid dehydratase/phosphogluconate dehydratase
VQEGDIIELDVVGRRLHLEVPEAILARRNAAWQPRPDSFAGYQGLYVKHVMQADRGADFDFLVGCRGAGIPANSH